MISTPRVEMIWGLKQMTGDADSICRLLFPMCQRDVCWCWVERTTVLLFSERVAGYWLLKREAAVVRREAGRAGADQR